VSIRLATWTVASPRHRFRSVFTDRATEAQTGAQIAPSAYMADLRVAAIQAFTESTRTRRHG